MNGFKLLAVSFTQHSSQIVVLRHAQQIASWEGLALEPMNSTFPLYAAKSASRYEEMKGIELL
jgi:hypothetical protein